MLSRTQSLAASATLSAFLAATHPALSGEKPPEIVDRHVIYLIDVSNSIDKEEYALMMQGIARALVSDVAKNQFNSGVRYGMSVAFFWKHSDPGLSSIIRNSEDAQRFAREALYDFEKNEAYPRPFNNFKTSIVSGYMHAEKIIREEADLGFVSTTREILVIGDGRENHYDDSTLAQYTQNLARNYNAVVSSVPVLVDPDAATDKFLTGYYASYIATPPNMYYINSRDMKMPLKAGHSYPAKGFEGIEEAVTKVIEYALY